jgi:beta-barrel assembly-enhancing protease
MMRLAKSSRVAMTVLALAIGLTSQANARLISESSELRMGQDAARQIEAQYPVTKDAHLTAVVQNIGQQLVKVSSRPNINWTFRVLDTKEVNALSVPGYVYINRGLIDLVGGDRHELAAVIGHEIAHTTARHAVKQAEKQMLGGAIVSMLFKKNNSRTATLFANLALLGYSRQDEYEADRLGVQYVRRAGYDPNGMVRFFKRLQAGSSREPSKLETYFRTHPPTSERIERVQAEIARLR